MGVVGGVKFVAADSEGWRMRVGQEKFKLHDTLQSCHCPSVGTDPGHSIDAK